MIVAAYNSSYNIWFFIDQFENAELGRLWMDKLYKHNKINGWVLRFFYSLDDLPPALLRQVYLT